MTKFASALSMFLLIASCSVQRRTGTGGAAGGSVSSTGGVEAESGAEGEAQAGSGGAATHSGGVAGEGGVGVEGGIGGIIGGDGGIGGHQVGMGGSGISGGSGDACAAEASPNDDRVSATAYNLGSAYTACLQSETDVDVYAFQVPADSRGGYVAVSVFDVGATGDIWISAYASSDAGRFYQTGSNVAGASAYMFFTVKPGAKFYLPITKYSEVKAPTPYTFSAVYHQVPDIYEPNDAPANANPIAVGMSIDAYMLGGRDSSMNIPADNWADWYKVDLAAGDAQILLSINASEVDGSIVLYNVTGSQVLAMAHDVAGSSVVLKQTITTPGTYYVKVSPYSPPPTEGTTTIVPQYLRYPYSLTVSQ